MIDSFAAAWSGSPLSDPWTLLTLGFLGVWTALDLTAFLQILVSQPLVSAWMAGWVVGDPATGLAVGIVMQGIWGRSLPLGSNPLPLAGPGAIVAGALAAAAPGPRFALGGVLTVPEALPLAVALLLGVGVASLGRVLLARIHRGREYVLRAALAAVAEGRPERVVRVNLLGMVPVGALGLLAVGGGILVGLLLGPGVRGGTGAHGGWVALPVLGLGIGQMVSLAGGKRVLAWVAGTLVLGLLVAGIP